MASPFSYSNPYLYQTMGQFSPQKIDLSPFGNLANTLQSDYYESEKLKQQKIATDAQVKYHEGLGAKGLADANLSNSQAAAFAQESNIKANDFISNLSKKISGYGSNVKLVGGDPYAQAISVIANGNNASVGVGGKGSSVLFDGRLSPNAFNSTLLNGATDKSQMQRVDYKQAPRDLIENKDGSYSKGNISAGVFEDDDGYYSNTNTPTKDDRVNAIVSSLQSSLSYGTPEERLKTAYDIQSQFGGELGSVQDSATALHKDMIASQKIRDDYNTTASGRITANAAATNAATNAGTLSLNRQQFGSTMGLVDDGKGGFRRANVSIDPMGDSQNTSPISQLNAKLDGLSKTYMIKKSNGTMTPNEQSMLTSAMTDLNIQIDSLSKEKSSTKLNNASDYENQVALIQQQKIAQMKNEQVKNVQSIEAAGAKAAKDKSDNFDTFAKHIQSGNAKNFYTDKPMQFNNEWFGNTMDAGSLKKAYTRATSVFPNATDDELFTHLATGYVDGKTGRTIPPLLTPSNTIGNKIANNSRPNSPNTTYMSMPYKYTDRQKED